MKCNQTSTIKRLRLACGWELGSRMGAWLEDESLLWRESDVIVEYEGHSLAWRENDVNVEYVGYSLAWSGSDVNVDYAGDNLA